MDTIEIAILKTSKVVYVISCDTLPSNEFLEEIVAAKNGDSWRQLEEKEEAIIGKEIEVRLQPFPSWVWDKSKRNWVAPIERTDPSLILWDEATRTWTAS